MTHNESFRGQVHVLKTAPSFRRQSLEQAQYRVRYPDHESPQCVPPPRNVSLGRLGILFRLRALGGVAGFLEQPMETSEFNPPISHRICYLHRLKQ